MFSIAPDKSPGPDGLHARFYQTHWDKNFPTIQKFIIDSFNTGLVDPEMNKTSLVLIPKIKNPTYIQDFRPISLLNTGYKILSKILVGRLKPLMPDLISPLQTGFIKGRHTLENFIIAQEMIHSIRRRTGRECGMIIKIDLHKAYDNVEWSFLERVLHFFNLPGSLIKLILGCMSSSSFAVQINGRQSEYFKSSKGMCQGDPLSPYLFILCL